MKSTASAAPINHNDAARLLDPAVAEFIRAHDGADTGALALQKWPDDTWPRAAILDQIAARAKARDKIPAWHARPGILFPRPDIVEQASSQACALYRASLFPHVRHFVDMTGGAGVDSWALTATTGARGIVFEQDGDTASYLRHNLDLLCGDTLRVVHGDSVAALGSMDACDLVLIDPARRTQGRRGLFRLGDLAPPVPGLMPDLGARAGHIAIKASPMLDIAQARAELGDDIAVNVVEWRGQCRELLLRAGAAETPGLRAVCVDDDGKAIWQVDSAENNAGPAPVGEPDRYLFEPAPAIHKAALTDRVAHIHGLKRLHPNTHLLTGPDPVSGFPGRAFSLLHVLRVDAAALGKVLPDRRASVSVRNFPMSADALKARMKTQESPDKTVFGARLSDGRTALLLAEKL